MTLRARVDPEWLRRRYLDDGVPVAQIAAEAGVSEATLHRHLAAAGLPRRGKAGTRQAPEIDRDWIAERRERGLSWRTIAAELGVDQSAVIWQAAGFGLWEVPPALRPKAVEAAELYRRNPSLRAVAEQVGADRRQVALWLRAMEVAVHPPGRRKR